MNALHGFSEGLAVHLNCASMQYINFIVSFKFLYRNVELVNSANQIENIINSKLYINDDYDFRIDFI